MPSLFAIAAMSDNRCIGSRGKIPWQLPLELEWFKARTMGGTLIMGRKTFKSIGKPLPGRETVVLSRTGPIKDVTTLADSSQLDTALKSLPAPYWICGGTDVYRQLLRGCDLLYLSRIKKIVSGDAFFPPFEDKFELDQTIFENDDFRVERWKRLYLPGHPNFEPEAWPLGPATT
jgi:dihydrofolate reductase